MSVLDYQEHKSCSCIAHDAQLKLYDSVKMATSIFALKIRVHLIPHCINSDRNSTFMC